MTARLGSDAFDIRRDDLAGPDVIALLEAHLAEILALWRERGVLALDGGHLFQTGSWASVLIGQRCLPRGVHALADRAEPVFAANQIRKIAGECAAAARAMPDHAEFIRQRCAAPELAQA